MKPLRWLGAAAAVLVVVVAAAYALGLPRRSAFLKGEEPHVCERIGQDTPLGPVTACTRLGRRTPPFTGPDATAFVLLETASGPAAVRIDYTLTDGGFSAVAREIPTWEAPGISHETGERIKEGMNNRGGLRSEGWTIPGR